MSARAIDPDRIRPQRKGSGWPGGLIGAASSDLGDDSCFKLRDLLGADDMDDASEFPDLSSEPCQLFFADPVMF
jgi:hypothetical protein